MSTLEFDSFHASVETSEVPAVVAVRVMSPHHWECRQCCALATTCECCNTSSRAQFVGLFPAVGCRRQRDCECCCDGAHRHGRFRMEVRACVRSCNYFFGAHS
jgi:hypothetical protein